jgi:hypothetical protein
VTRLRCVGRYVNDPRGIAYNVGETFDADEAMTAYLLADAPGCFEPAATASKAMAAPPADKAIKTPDKTK